MSKLKRLLTSILFVFLMLVMFDLLAETLGIDKNKLHIAVLWAFAFDYIKTKIKLENIGDK